MAKQFPHDQLSRRERQVLEIIIRLGNASARDIERELPDPPSYSAVRSVLRILTQRKLITKKEDANRDIYSSAIPAEEAKVSALKTLVNRFFENSISHAACTLLSQKETTLTANEAKELIDLIKKAQQKER
ncbi:MAG: BlaI/MecI/CopY family transcriptional regulator [Verrucomicrobiales bacterium]|jgi:predicted transcriptional regulator|nr:BlaI/MecI/CopY family transcriptional regulator [Verrucomicrobiales bacterium]